MIRVFIVLCLGYYFYLAVYLCIQCYVNQLWILLQTLNNYDNVLLCKRKQFTTTLREDLKKVKILAVENDKAVNDLLEEALEWLLKKYEKQPK